MRKLSLLLAITMMFTMTLSTMASAETSAAEIVTVSATDTQVRLGTTVKELIEVDGLQFKDLNGNGQLDVYEDWRADTEDRVTDLLSQMTLKEKTMLLYHICTCSDNTGVDFSNPDTLYLQEGTYDGSHYSMWVHINEFGITHYLDNSNGTPDEQVYAHNEMQSMAEGTRLGIPITFSSDREYNAWGGYIDTPHKAFATAGDVDLAKKIWESYSAQTRAVGYHVLLQPSGEELGSANGDDPVYVAKMAAEEIASINEGGAKACVKHFIAISFESNASEARNIDNYMVGWKAAIGAGAQWIMTNSYGKGLCTDLTVDYDGKTVPYLRNELDYNGIIVTDWGSVGNDYGTQSNADGSMDFSKFSMSERYAWVLNNGVDQLGSPGACATEEEAWAASGPGLLYVDGVLKAAEQGLITEERLNESCRRVLRFKFEQGLFENPYSDGAEALAMAASDAFIAEKWEITDNETLAAARNPEQVALEQELQAKSAVLVKNEDNLLPLEKGIKVYIDSTSSAANLESYKKYIGNYATVVDDLEDADVVVADCTKFNDAAEMMVEDALDADKKLVLIANYIDPTAWAMESGDAVLYLSFSRTADHGTGVAGISSLTEADVLADLLFGVREPEGHLVQEVARDEQTDGEQWNDLAGDLGLDTYTRLILEGTMLTSENHATPSNWGDPLLQYRYGMRYGQQAELSYSVLVLPKVAKEVEVELWGSKSMSMQNVEEARAGEPFTIYCLVWNNGADGVETVKVYDGETLLGEKQMALTAGSWRVLKLDVTIDQPGEHTITVGNLSSSIQIVE